MFGNYTGDSEGSGDGHSLSAEEHDNEVENFGADQPDGYSDERGGGFGSGYINSYYNGDGYGDGQTYGDGTGDS